MYADYGNEEYNSCKKLPSPLQWTEKSFNFPFSAQFLRLDFVRHLLAVIGAMI